MNKTIGFIKKGTANIQYAYESADDIRFVDYFYRYQHRNDIGLKNKIFSLAGYRLVIQGTIKEVGVDHITLGKRRCTIKPQSLANLINDKKTVGSKIYLIVKKANGDPYWEYLLQSDLKGQKARPVDSLIKDDKMRKLLSSAGWTHAAINRKLNEKGKSL
jgi:hypothetical protein|tara:strand:- start:1405 stop:1884 length:480 start_codon:yes stop_codon:yes gene_type:complete